MARVTSNSSCLSSQRKSSISGKASTKRRVSFLDRTTLILPKDDELMYFGSTNRVSARNNEPDTKKHHLASEHGTRGGYNTTGSPTRQLYRVSHTKDIKSILKNSSTENPKQRTHTLDSCNTSADIKNISFDGQTELANGFKGYVDTPKKQLLSMKLLQDHSQYPKYYFQKDHYDVMTPRAPSREWCYPFPSHVTEKRQPSSYATSRYHSAYSDNGKFNNTPHGNSLNMTDLYPAVSNYQRQSTKQTVNWNHVDHNKLNTNYSRYETARERISRAGKLPHAKRNDTVDMNQRHGNYRTNSHGGVAESSLLHRLRKTERNPYVAWQEVTRNLSTTRNFSSANGNSSSLHRK